MQLFTYHLIQLTFFQAIRLMLCPLKTDKIKGLIYAETMSAMILGSPVFSTSRFLSRDLVIFAQWHTEEDFNDFITNNSLGKKLSKGWYTKLEFLRQWGHISGFIIPDTNESVFPENNPVIAITIAKMKYTEIPRFLRWGRPVEKLVRDHPGTTLSLASIRYPNIISTLSIWKTQKEMTDMVNGHGRVSDPERHRVAMKERNRKDFHYEFTTLRFKPISEFGVWKGQSKFIPTEE